MQPLNVAVVVLIACTCIQAEPPSPDKIQDQRRTLAALEQAIAAAGRPSEKLARCTDALRDATDADFRGRILEIASKIAAPELEAFLIPIARTDPDAMVRGRAATILGHITGKRTPQFPEGYNAD